MATKFIRKIKRTHKSISRYMPTKTISKIMFFSGVTVATATNAAPLVDDLGGLVDSLTGSGSDILDESGAMAVYKLNFGGVTEAEHDFGIDFVDTKSIEAARANAGYNDTPLLDGSSLTWDHQSATFLSQY